MTPESFAELRVKHLEMIQAIIDRMSSHGATLKSFCLTLTTAVAGFALTVDNPTAGLFALLPITIFALLDARYLWVERRFRGLFDRVRSEDWGVITSFEISLTNAPAMSYLRAFFSWSILIFYAPLALGVVAVVLIAGCFNGRPV